MCADAKQWLQAQYISFSFQEIFVQPLSQDELQALGKKTPAGIHDLYAPKGARKVGLPETERSFSPEQIVSLQVGNPDLIRYPLFELDDQLLFGFQPGHARRADGPLGEPAWPTK
jgi:arsenate reductase-like glutaredoxin family protein